MFAPKIRTNISRTSLAAILNGNAAHNSPFNSAQFLFFSDRSLQELDSHGVRPINGLYFGGRVRDVSDRFSHAHELFDAMSRREAEFARSLVVFRILRSVSEGWNLTSTGMVHALAVKQGALADLYTSTSLLTVYSRCKGLESSVALFGEVLDRDVRFWNSMVSAFVENKHFQSAFGCFVNMVGEGYEFDFVSLVIALKAISNLKVGYQGDVVHGLSIKAGMLSETVLSNAVIDMYAKCGHLRSSEYVFAGVECKDMVSWNTIISACFYNNHSEKSLWYFKQMASCGYKAEDTSISCAIAACISLKEFAVGLAIHGLGIKLGVLESVCISGSNSLISFYFKLRDTYSAKCVFESLEVKNIVSWNAMIRGLFLNEEAAQAFHLLRDMQSVTSFQPDLATFLTVIPSCADLSFLRVGKAAHGFVIRRDMASDLSVINSLMNLYSKCKKVKEAEYFFSLMPKTDLIAWNTMIFGYTYNGQSSESQRLFKKLLRCNLTFTLPTALAIIASCESPDSVHFGRSIHGWSIKLGFSSNNFALNSLIDMYIVCGLLSDAFTLFQQVSVTADVTTWNTVISGCIRKGLFWEALEYFNSMRKASRVRCTCTTLVSVVSSCGNLGLAYQGRLLHTFAIKIGAVLDIRMQNSLVMMYGRLGDTESAKLAFNLDHDHNLYPSNCLTSGTAQNEDVRIAQELCEDARRTLEFFRSIESKPGEAIICTILAACTQLRAMTQGSQIHGHAIRFRLHQKPSISAALVEMYSACGRLDAAEKVILSSPDKTVAVWNCLISAYEFHNLASKAIETFEEMTRTGIAPTRSSFTSLLSACNHSGLVDEGRRYYDQMFRKYKVQPGVEHHRYVVDMLGRAGRLNEAYDFIKGLPTQVEPGICATLLSACSCHGDLEMGEKVAEILFSLEPENVSYYLLLCDMYIAAGRCEEAVELRAVIHNNQVKKQVGWL